MVDKAIAGGNSGKPEKNDDLPDGHDGGRWRFAGVVILKDTITGKIKFRNEIEK